MLPAQVKNQSGQILVIFLLVLVVGLAITLSIASRTVTDIRQTTTSDESNRSYFAAESGVEKALRNIEDTPGYTTAATGVPLDLNGVNRSSANYVVTDLPYPASPSFDFPNTFAKDEVAQVNLMTDFNDITTAGAGIAYNGTLNIFWDDHDAPLTSPNIPAIEVSIVTCTATCTTTPVFDIKKMTFDPDSGRASSNHFCTGNPAITTPGSGYRYQVALLLDDNTNCTNNDKLANTGAEKPVMARIRFLYNGTSVKLGVSNASGNLPKQGQTITSTGSTPSGVTRKLVVTRLYPSLPAIFDYVLFNGSGSPLTKN